MPENFCGTNQQIDDKLICEHCRLRKSASSTKFSGGVTQIMRASTKLQAERNLFCGERCSGRDNTLKVVIIKPKVCGQRSKNLTPLRRHSVVAPDGTANITRGLD